MQKIILNLKKRFDTSLGKGENPYLLFNREKLPAKESAYTVWYFFLGLLIISAFIFEVTFVQ